METKTKIFGNVFLHVFMLLMFLGWNIAAWADDNTGTDMVIYSTDFQDWENSSPTTPATNINKETVDGQNLMFSLYNVLVDNTGQNTKFKSDCIDLGYARAEKATDATKAYIETTLLKSVTTLTFTQAATGGADKRGWSVAIKGQNETEWTPVYTSAIGTAAGIEVTIPINKENVQLRFYNRFPTENAYMTALAIKGNVVQPNQSKVSYYDTDGKTLIGEQTITKGTTGDKLSLTYKYGADNVTIATGYVFRGWYNSPKATSKKVSEGTELYKDIRLYAKATPKEEALSGNEFTYDFTKSYWSQDEHDLITITNGQYKKQHGWRIEKGGTIKLQVAQQTQITVVTCNKKGGVVVTDADGNEVTSFAYGSATDGNAIVFNYEGEKPTILTFTMTTATYIHSIDVLNINPVYVSFSTSTKKIEGKMPDKIRGDKDNKVTMPGNYSFYREGWTFTGWTDGTNIYERGKTYAFDSDITLRPKMLQNHVDITDTNSPLDVVWHFDHKKAPAINLSNSTETSMIYTVCTNVEGEAHDIDLRINAEKGMLVNTDKSVNALTDGTAGAQEADGAQISDGLKLTVPAVYGMKVQIHASDKKDKKTYTKFGDGSNYAHISLNKADSLYTKMEVADNGKTMMLTYKGEATSLEFTISKAGTAADATYGFYKDVTVTYPVLPNVVAVKTLESVDKENFPNEKAENAGTEEIEIPQKYPNTGSRLRVGDIVTVVAVPEYGYTVKGFRVEGSDKYLDMKSVTDKTTGETFPAADYTVTEGITKIEVVYGHLALHKVTAKAADANLGKVSLSPAYENLMKNVYNEQGKLIRTEAWYTQNTTVTAFAEPEAGYITDYWTEDETTEQKSPEANTHDVVIGNVDRIITLYLKKGTTGSVEFDFSGVKVNGSTPAYNNAKSLPIGKISNVKSFTIPTNYTFFKNVDDNGNATEKGYSLKYWTDSEGNRYEIGNTYSFRNSLLKLKPMFEKNPTTHENRVSNTIIRYDFGTNVHYYDDPISNTKRMVCAQIVNIDNNQKTFWTAKADVKVLQDGLLSSHTRDVALWCDTGSKGYIRNTGLDEWASFGPGTTFWCTAGVGTKISMLSYSKITTTTIDGVVPTIDKTRTDKEREKEGLPTLDEEEASGKKVNLYVYSHTVENTDTRIPIVIGDDYSYYKWMEVSVLATNMVNLHADVDNEQHGNVTDISTISDYGAKELEDGGYAIRQGDRVELRFNRLFGYDFDRIIYQNVNNEKENPLPVLKMREDGKVDMIDFDGKSVVTVDKHTDIDGNDTWGTATGNGKTVFVLKRIEPTAEEAESGKRTAFELEFNITTHRALEICYKEKTTYYITYNAGKFASGIPPVAQWVEDGDKYVIPQNNCLYYEGNTLDHWEDNDGNKYAIGSAYTATAEDLRLFPVFKPNQFSILDISKPQSVTWALNTKEGAQEMNISNVEGILVSQLYNEAGERIDLKIDLTGEKDANGKIECKFDNTANSEYMQINAKSIIGFPATANCVLKMTATADPSSVNVAGKGKGDEGYLSGNKYIEVTCSGDTAVQNMNFSVPLSCYDITVTYQPQIDLKKPTIQSLTCGETTYTAKQIADIMKANNGNVVFYVSPWENTSGEEKIPEITGTATENGKVEQINLPTLSSTQSTVNVKTATGFIVESYPITFVFNKPDDDPQLLSMTINGTKYTGKNVEINDVARNGVVKLTFNRTMDVQTIKIGNSVFTANSGKQLTFKYWDLEAGATLQVSVPAGTFKDIYGKTYSEAFNLTLHISDGTYMYRHQNFDFIVGTNGTIDDAIKAANSNTKGGNNRYFIFVPDGEYQLTGNEPIANLGNKNNGVTKIEKSNISIIGQSKKGTTIWNLPAVEGSSYTGTIHIGKNIENFYAEDLTIENRYDYWGATGGAGRAVAFWDQGNRSIMKNVALMSWQDTYYSNNAKDFRGYLEDCDIAGVVDFLCGDGDIWFEKCNILLRDRAGNNIAAPSTQIGQKWGYVLNNCCIKSEAKNPQLIKDNDWTLARPWNGSPACTYINTRMYTQPRTVGWTKMNSGEIVRFHEYRSMDANGALISLGRRSLAATAPGPGSDDCVLSDELAATYTKRNVLSGEDAFEPDALCRQIDAVSAADEDKDENSMTWNDNIYIDDNNLTWDAYEPALCYFVFKLDEDSGKWKYLESTIGTSVSLTGYGSGYYCVRAANQMGGLGAATQTIQFVLQDPYELEIKQTGNLTVDGVPYGWSTICLPYNARVPEDVMVYAATAHDKNTADDKVVDFVMTLTPVSVTDSLKGYVVYGPAGTHYFNPTSRTCDKATILEGNATKDAISAANKSCYVLANKAWGIGFYKFSGSTLAAYRAWLPQRMVDDKLDEVLSTGTRAIRFEFDNGTSPIYGNPYDKGFNQDDIYDLNGNRIVSPMKQSVYISRGKGKFWKK